MGAPIRAQIFQTLTAAPSAIAIAYNEVYNAIQTSVIAGFENKAASIQHRKFHELAPSYGPCLFVSAAIGGVNVAGGMRDVVIALCPTLIISAQFSLRLPKSLMPGAFA